MLRDSERRAAAFQRIREAHQSETAEDYVELIDDLIAERGEARLVEIASFMGVSKATATQTVQRLKRQGLLEAEPYRSVCLTQAGQDLAAQARRRHQILYDFLLALGIDDATAHADAEGMEHHCSEQTLDALRRLTVKIRS